jgi:hypothetical protein
MATNNVPDFITSGNQSYQSFRNAVTTGSGIDLNAVDPLYKDAVSAMQAAQIPDNEIATFLDTQATAAAQAAAAKQRDDAIFQQAQSELDSMSQREAAMIQQQAAEFEAAQQQLAAQAAADLAAAQAEQARLAEEAAAYQKQAEEKAAQIKKEGEDFQRTTAEKDVARKRAGRSTVARPLLAGATAGPTAPTLGVGGGMATGSALGSTGTLGVG